MSRPSAASEPAAELSTGSLPWVEKYRPRTVDDVVHQVDVTKSLKRSLESGNLPHLLFYGPPGTGKTSTILALAREMFGDDFRKRNVLELNASDERGIQVVRDKVRSFSKTSVSRNKTGSAFKIVILDEADCMTPDAQAALRRTMEAHARITRFCLICNYVSRVIDPLASRCAKFRFQPLSRSVMAPRLHMVAEKESASLEKEACDAILDAAEGDMRRAMTLLQSAYRLGGTSIDAHVVHEASGRLPPTEAQRFVESLRSGQYGDAERAADHIFAEGYATDTVLAQLYDQVAASEHLSDAAKARIALKFAEADKRIADGATERAQLLDCLAVASQAAKAQA